MPDSLTKHESIALTITKTICAGWYLHSPQSDTPEKAKKQVEKMINVFKTTLEVVKTEIP